MIVPGILGEKVRACRFLKAKGHPTKFVPYAAQGHPEIRQRPRFIQGWDYSDGFNGAPYVALTTFVLVTVNRAVLGGAVSRFPMPYSIPRNTRMPFELSTLAAAPRHPYQSHVIMKSCISASDAVALCCQEHDEDVDLNTLAQTSEASSFCCSPHLHRPLHLQCSANNVNRST